MTVGYQVPLPKNRFVPHAVWEFNGTDEQVDEIEIWNAFDNCLSKGWITLTEYDYPEFTVDGNKLWTDISNSVTR